MYMTSFNHAPYYWQKMILISLIESAHTIDLFISAETWDRHLVVLCVIERRWLVPVAIYSVVCSIFTK